MKDDHRQDAGGRTGTQMGESTLKIRVGASSDLSDGGADEITGSFELQPTMYSYSGEVIGIAGSQDDCHCRACRHAGDKDAVRVDGRSEERRVGKECRSRWS